MKDWFKKKKSEAEEICEDVVEVCGKAQEAVESVENLGRSIESTVNIAKDLGTSIVNGLNKLKGILDERTFKVPFTYAESIRYFASHANDRPEIAKGAILRRLALNGKTDEKCWEITLIFLDRNNNLVCDANNVPLGFKTVRAEIDSELRNAFKDNDMIIVE